MRSILSTLLHSASVGASRLVRLRFEAQARRAGAVNERLLQRILERHQHTEFGRRHRFSAIRSASDFQRAVPLGTYDAFRADIERVARGERNVLTADPVTAFALTSGTTGTQKLVPFTAFTERRLLQDLLVSRGALFAAIPAASEARPAVALMSALLTGRTEGGFPTASVSTIMMRSLLQRRSGPWTSPPEAFLVPTQADAFYVHLLFALAEPALGAIAAPFASGLLDFFQILGARGPALVEDLGRGSLRGDIAIPPEVEQPIRARLRPHPERARAVARELERGMDGIAPRLWPGLSHLSGITGGSFRLYAEKLARYLGGLPVYSPIYVSSEAMIGVNPGAGEPVYALLPSSAFYEFIPAAELDAERPSVRRIDELSEGERYELVVTTHGGLYRYRMGDVIEVARHHRRTPVVAFIYRRGSLLNIAGEKTSEHALHHALDQALSKEALGLVDFSAMEDAESAPKRYVIFVELTEDSRPASVERLAARLDEALREANPYYATLRGRLGPPSLHLVQPGTFRELRALMIRRGASPSQVKVPRAVTEGPLAELLMARRDVAAEPAGRPGLPA
ncbi:GH3 auxin-responsive promoter family protein [Sorangium sp. So ce1099]|uniref:GH3 auxin-responsive promoter family protein n=1 Tax=Sorangium sp. So ce1099 TaxID=3133331 RepID=UPI003F649147